MRRLLAVLPLAGMLLHAQSLPELIARSKSAPQLQAAQLFQLQTFRSLISSELFLPV